MLAKQFYLRYSLVIAGKQPETKMDDYIKKVLAQMEAARARDKSKPAPAPVPALWINKDQPKFEFTAEMYGCESVTNTKDKPEGD